MRNNLRNVVFHCLTNNFFPVKIDEHLFYKDDVTCCLNTAKHELPVRLCVSLYSTLTKRKSHANKTWASLVHINCKQKDIYKIIVESMTQKRLQKFATHQLSAENWIKIQLWSLCGAQAGVPNNWCETLWTTCANTSCFCTSNLTTM